MKGAFRASMLLNSRVPETGAPLSASRRRGPNQTEKQMTKLNIAVLLAFAGALLVATTAGAAADPAKGKQIFLDAKCNKCHAVASQKIEAVAEEGDEAEEGAKPPDLSNAGADFKKAADVEAWITKKSERDGKKHRATFRGSADDLGSLAAWIMTLKKAG